MWICPKCREKNDTRELLCSACGISRFNKLSDEEKRQYDIPRVKDYLRSKGVDPDVPCHIIKVNMDRDRSDTLRSEELVMPGDLE